MSGSSHDQPHPHFPSESLAAVKRDVAESDVEVSRMSESCRSPATSKALAQAHLTHCGVYFSDLITYYNLKPLDYCPGCNHQVFKHPRLVNPVHSGTTPLDQRFSASSSSRQTHIPKESLPIWKPSEHRTMIPFLQRFENIMVSFDVNPCDYNQILIRCFPDIDDQNWVRREVYEKHLSWNETISTLSLHFDSANYKDELYLLYRQCYCQSRESVQRYGGRMKSIISQLGYRDDDEHVINHFIDGLPPLIKKKLKEKINDARISGLPFSASTSLQRLIEVCISYDVIENGFSPLAFSISDSHELESESSKSFSHEKFSVLASTQSYSAREGATLASHFKKSLCPNHPRGNHSFAECSLNPVNAPTDVSKQGTRGRDNQPSVSLASRLSSPSRSPGPEPALTSPPPHASAVSKFCNRCRQEGHTISECNLKVPDCDPPPPLHRSPYPLRSQFSKPTVSSMEIAQIPESSDEHLVDSESGETQSDHISVSTVTLTALDRTLHESIVIPRRKHVFFLTDGHVLSTLLDLGANASCIDERLVSEAKLPIQPIISPIVNDLADTRHKSECSGRYVTIEFEALFPFTSRKAMKVKHHFFVLPVRSPSKRYDVIVGTDLVYHLFPTGIPEEFAPRPFKKSSHPVQLSAPAITEAPSVMPVKVREEPVSLMPIDNTNTADLLELGKHIHDTGAGDLPLGEIPMRVCLLTPDEQLKHQHDIKQADLWLKLEHAFEWDAASITGFCNVNVAMGILAVYSSPKHIPFCKEYPYSSRELYAPRALSVSGSTAVPLGHGCPSPVRVVLENHFQIANINCVIIRHPVRPGLNFRNSISRMIILFDRVPEMYVSHQWQSMSPCLVTPTDRGRSTCQWYEVVGPGPPHPGYIIMSITSSFPVSALQVDAPFFTVGGNALGYSASTLVIRIIIDISPCATAIIDSFESYIRSIDCQGRAHATICLQQCLFGCYY
jgi:hypothetical protein